MSRETEECRIGGFSIGGILTLETAGKLKEQGLKIGSPILLDSLIDTLFPILPRFGFILMKLLNCIINCPGFKEAGLGNLKINGRPLIFLFSYSGLLAQIE